VSPLISPLVAYYRGYCRQLLGQNPASDYRDAAMLPTRYIFPFRPSSFQVLNAALQANASDATAHLLLGRLLLNRLLTDEAIAEWQKARALHPSNAELYRDLAKALVELKKDPTSALAVVKEGLKAAPQDSGLRTLSDSVTGSPAPVTAPPATGATPLEIAQAAQLLAAGGKPIEGARLFDPRVFSAEKQPNEVRRAYIEVQLQGLVVQAGSESCAAAIRQLDSLGGEDTKLAFTFNGFNAFMNAPHFEYYSALLEAGCGEEKSAKKRWAKLAKTNLPISSPEYVYPLMAAWKLNPEEAKPRISAALATVQAALEKNGGLQPQLLFFEGMLLRAAGQATEAANRLQSVAKDNRDNWVQYLATLGLRESLQAIK
jgi:tetratricopeptide (TPR) repeat protein